VRSVIIPRDAFTPISLLVIGTDSTVIKKENGRGVRDGRHNPVENGPVRPKNAPPPVVGKPGLGREFEDAHHPQQKAQLSRAKGRNARIAWQERRQATHTYCTPTAKQSTHEIHRTRDWMHAQHSKAKISGIKHGKRRSRANGKDRQVGGEARRLT
jgi:hypothetical protein